jgi:ABC-type transport system involved in Fe-S cluster assembly fused permease/ATPase subunit
MKHGKNIFMLLWPYIWSDQSLVQKFKFIVFILATVVTTLMLVCVPILLKYVVMALSSKQSVLSLAPIVIVGAYGVLWALSKIVDRLRHQAAFPMISNIIHKLCLDLFFHLQKLSMRFHHDRKTGEIFNTVSRTRYAIAGFTQAIAQELVPIFLQIVLASVFLGYYFGFEYTSLLLIMLSLYVVLSVKTADSIIARRRVQNKADGRANAYIVDSLLNAQTVKYFDTAEFEQRQAKTLLIKKEEADVASLMSDAKIHLIQNGVIGLSIMIITLCSGFDVLNKQMNVSDFVMVNGFILMFMIPLASLGYRYREAKLQLTHLESAFALLQQPIEINDRADAKPFVFESGNIEFKNVTFSYVQDRVILKDLSFSVGPGTTTAIVGLSGSGKSTISKLLFRLYDVDAGSITIDKQDVRAMTRKSLCETIGIVPQDTLLFNDTLENNICYALEDKNIDLKNILHAVSLDGFVARLPKGLQTMVGERGLKLSGGERQRLAIARLLARQPKIMVFDEATSALDVVTERKIQDCVMKVSKPGSCIIIAHRLSTIKHADTIIVLDQGRIAEQGSHQHLLQAKGLYYRLLLKQKVAH